MVAILVTSLSFGQSPIITIISDGDCSGGNPKMVEIYADGMVDFSLYSIQRQSNGGAWTEPGFNLAALGTVTDGFVYVYSDSSDPEVFATEYPSATTTVEDGIVNVNGDDGIRIVLDSDSSVIDQFGVDAEDGTGMPWEYLDGFAKRIDGSGPDGGFVLANWTYSNGGLNGGGDCQGGSIFETIMGGIGTYSPMVNTNPTVTITSPNDFQVFPSGTTDVNIEFTTANAPGATVTLTVTVNGGTPDVNPNASSPFQIASLADGDTVTVTADLIDGGVLDFETIDFSIAYPCDLQVGTITATCDNITPASDDTYNVTLAYTGGGTTAYTVDTGGIGTVGGDDPSSVADGTITITGVTEGTDFTVTFTGNPANSSCDFTRNINSPDCDPSLPLPLYEGFDYAVASELRNAPNWENISDSSDEILIGGPGGLTYPNLASSSQTGNHVTFDGTGSDTAIEFTAVTSGAIYASFLINVTDNAAVDTPGYFAVLGGFDARLWAVPGTNPGEFQIGISNVNSAPTAGELDGTTQFTGTTLFVVMSYDLNTGTISAWVNPSEGTFGGSAPTANAVSTEAGDVVTSFNQFALRQDSGNETPFILFDELRIGETWADVTPTTLSTDEFSANAFKVYPNPTSLGYVNIVSADSQAISVAVYDILGKEVINSALTNNKLNVSDLNSGVYIMKISQNNATVTKKLIIK